MKFLETDPLTVDVYPLGFRDRVDDGHFGRVDSAVFSFARFAGPQAGPARGVRLFAAILTPSQKSSRRAAVEAITLVENGRYRSASIAEALAMAAQHPYVLPGLDIHVLGEWARIDPELRVEPYVNSFSGQKPFAGTLYMRLSNGGGTLGVHHAGSRFGDCVFLVKTRW